MCIKKFIVEQGIKCTNEISTFSLWFYENSECYAHKIDFVNKLIKCKWTVIADRQKKQAKRILSHK